MTPRHFLTRVLARCGALYHTSALRIAWMAALLVFPSLLSSARDTISWVDKNHDFGLIKEVAGPVSARSHFVNVGTDTISIFSVKPTCGCTTSDFYDELIAPGDTAYIGYTFDPAKRPGRFRKTIKVALSDGSTHSIIISGNVLGTPESLSSLYPVDAGPVRLSDTILTIPSVTTDHAPMVFLKIYSLSMDSIDTQLKADHPALCVSATTTKAGPGDVLVYSLDFVGNKYGDYGDVEVPLHLMVDGTEVKSLLFRTFVLPDQGMLMRRQGDKHPICLLAPDPIDLGVIDPNATRRIKREFTITNQGKCELHPLKVYSQSEAITFGKIPAKIKPGKSTRIKIEIDVDRLADGPWRFPINVITDDPLHPHLTIPVAGFKK
ncbi:MAG: DUF1573 domain-containing protein [Lepagella sp.]